MKTNDFTTMKYNNTADVLVVLPTLGDRLDTLLETLISIDNQRKEVNLRTVVVIPPNAKKARLICAEMGVEVVDDFGGGISEATNRGLQHHKGEKYYAWMGDDDLFRDGGLSELVELISGCPDAVLAFGACDYISPEGRTIATNNSGPLASLLLPFGPDLIPHPGTLFKLPVLLEIGGYDTNLQFAMDLDVLLKLKKIGPFLFTKKTVSAFRWHPESLTVANRKKSSLEAERVKRGYLPKLVRPFSKIWDLPFRYAAIMAAKLLNRRAKTLV